MEMVKREIMKEDGRYLIFYEFKEKVDLKAKESQGKENNSNNK
ncbi:MAG: hypothetical protein ACHQYO_08450 [Halanaerobiales bacterium]